MVTRARATASAGRGTHHHRLHRRTRQAIPRWTQAPRQPDRARPPDRAGHPGRRLVRRPDRAGACIRLPRPGTGRPPGAVIITGCLAFVSALAITIAQARVSPAAVPAAVITVAGTILLARPPEPARCPAGAGRAAWWQRRSLLPGWNVGRLWTLSLALCLIIAACDAATGPQLILIGLLICGPLLRTAHRPVGADRRIRRLRPRPGRGTRRPRPDIRDIHPVRVPVSHHSSHRGSHRRRSRPATTVPLTAADPIIVLTTGQALGKYGHGFNHAA